MIHVSTEFIALPKEYEYPEDLEWGIYSIVDRVVVIYQPEIESYAIYVDGIYDSDYPLEKYWIFLKGELRNGKTELITGNED